MSIGARGCSAPFIFKRYYSPDSSQEEMLRIAAHTVLMGHKIDPATIDGLETVVCSRGRLRILSENELAELRKFSEQIDEQIRYKFIEPSASP
jgi:20S proteasome alpha/beta subunit